MGEESPFREQFSQPKTSDPSARTFLGGARLATRIRLFVGFGLVFVIALGTLFFLAEQRLSAALDGLAQARRLADLAGRVELGTIRQRGDENSFLLSGDIRHARSYNKRVDPLMANLKSLEDLPAAEDVRRNILTIKDGVAQRSNEFAEIIEIKKLLGLKENTGLQNLVRSWAMGLERNLSQSGAAALIAEFARLRGIEQRVSAGAKEDDLREIKAGLSNFASLLTKAKMPEKLRGTLRELIRKYGADLRQLNRTGGSLAGKVDHLGEINAYMAPSLDGLIAFGQKSILTAGRELAGARQWARRAMIGGGGGAALAFLLCGFLLMRSVTQPVGNLAKAAMRLAGGDHGAPIPATGNYDETGDLANALTFFRENMVQADRLRKELEDHLRTAVEQPAEPEPPETIAEEEFVPPSLTAGAEAKPSSGRADQAPDSAISELTKQVTQTSQLASVAAFEAEKTESMVAGLGEAAEKVKEIEKLVLMINDQSSLLAVQTALDDGPPSPKNDKLVAFSSAERSSQNGNRSLAHSVSDRIDDIQVTAQRTVTAVREMGQTIERINEVAIDFAAETSNQALNAATDLLRQSEDLRSSLDSLIGKMRPTANP